MDEKTIDRIISKERFEPYLKYQDNNFDKAMKHHKANIEISRSFYPLLSILEIGLRNSIDYQMTRRFGTREWYDNHEFIKMVKSFQIERISEARKSILAVFLRQHHDN